MASIELRLFLLNYKLSNVNTKIKTLSVSATNRNVLICLRKLAQYPTVTELINGYPSFDRVFHG